MATDAVAAGPADAADRPRRRRHAVAGLSWRSRGAAECARGDFPCTPGFAAAVPR